MISNEITANNDGLRGPETPLATLFLAPTDLPVRPTGENLWSDDYICVLEDATISEGDDSSGYHSWSSGSFSFDYEIDDHEEEVVDDDSVCSDTYPWVMCYEIGNHPASRYRNYVAGRGYCRACFSQRGACVCWTNLTASIRARAHNNPCTRPSLIVSRSYILAYLAPLPDELIENILDYVPGIKCGLDMITGLKQQCLTFGGRTTKPRPVYSILPNGSILPSACEMEYHLAMDYYERRLVCEDIRARNYSLRCVDWKRVDAKSRWEADLLMGLSRPELWGMQDYDEQAFEEVTKSIGGLVDQVSRVKSVPLPDKLYSHLEGVCILITGLYSAQNMTSAISAILAYARSVTNDSIAASLKKVFIAASWSEQDNEGIDWLELLRAARKNWRLAIQNQHFSNLQSVLSIMVALGMCDSSSVTFSIGGVKLFTQHAAPKQTSACDLIDAVLSTIVAFVEGGIECFRTGSISPMFYGDLEMTNLEKEAIRCETLYQYAKTGNLADKEPNMTDNEFIKLQETVIEKLAEMKKTAKSPLALKMLEGKLDKLRREKTEFDRIRTKGGLRIAPWSGLIFGPSGVGKSTVANIVMVSSLLQNGYPATDEYIITDNANDKFDSTLKSFVTGIFFDDMCNTKGEFLNESPVARVIEVNNNVRAYGTMAEIDLKGKVSKEPKVTVTTTNVKNLNAHEYSNEPISIERRFNFVMTVRVKPEYATPQGMLDPNKMAEKFKDHEEVWADGTVHKGIPIIPNVWDISIEKAIPAKNPTPGRPDLTVYSPIIYEGKAMYDVDILKFLRWNKEASAVHFKNQKNLISNQAQLANKMQLCECGVPKIYCTCSPKMEEQFGGLIATFAVNAYEARKKRLASSWNMLQTPLETRLLKEMERRVKTLEEHPLASWTNWLPESWLYDKDVMQLILWSRADELAKAIFRRYCQYTLLLAVAIALFCFVGFRSYFTPIYVLMTLFYLMRIAQVITVEKYNLYARIRHENGSMSATFKANRDAMVTYVTNGCLILGAIYVIACILRHIKASAYVEQGTLSPKTDEDIEKRHQEAALLKTIATEQNWQGYQIDPIPSTEASKTTTTDQLLKKVWTNQVVFEVEKDGVYQPACGMFFVESNLALIPQHMWKPGRETVKIKIYRGTRRTQAFEAIIGIQHSVQLEGTDLCLVYIPNAGSWADMRDYLPIESYAQGRTVPMKFIYKVAKDEPIPRLVQCDTAGKFTEVSTNTGKKYPGAEYKLTFATNPGLCMGALITRDSRETQIVGFHTAGRNGLNDGAMCSLIRRQYDGARDKLSKVFGVSLCASSGDMQEQTYGYTTVIAKTLHEKSPINDIPVDTRIDVFGCCTGRATYHTDVVPTPICDTVKRVCSYTKEYTGPKFHKGKAWSDCLSYCTKPSVGVEPHLLEKACEDLFDHIVEGIDKFPKLRNGIRKLTELENVSGNDNMRFIDKLNPKTSVGHPTGGTKEKYLTDLPKEDHPECACPRQLHGMFWDEWRRIERCYKIGKRTYPVFKACLKDEPTPADKDKVRVIQACPLAFQLGLREYFLTTAATLSCIPLISECAVGVNTMGPEFHELIEHVKKFGEERILAGDYSKYDLRMPAQLILAAFDILIRIARRYGFTEEDEIVMRGLATDVAYPTIAFNGDLIGLVGSNPSGQNLTVYINSLVNSLLLRCAYYHIYDGKCVAPFHHNVAVMTYGDDVKGSVREGFDAFNHMSYAKFLKERDMVFTMPDKTSDPVPYMKEKDADFLKRKSVFNKHLGIYLGALDEDSIFKSLTSVLKSKAVSPLEQSIQNMDGALREWFMHGEEVYERRRTQMMEVAKEHSISCDMLSVSYHEYLRKYAERYGLECL